MRGVVDFLSAPEVQKHGVDLLSDHELERLVIDLLGITFIDSLGLSTYFEL